MENVHFYFDEAGEKGFLEGEFSDEVFGLVAGIALPTRNVNQVNKDLRTIFSGFNCDDVEKIHATEIFKNGATKQPPTKVGGFKISTESADTGQRPVNYESILKLSFG